MIVARARSVGLACCAVLFPLVAFAAPEALPAKVVSVRGRRVYLELEVPAVLEPGGSVALEAKGESLSGELLAASSKFLLVRLPVGARPPGPGTAVRVRGGAPAPPPEPQVAVGPPRPARGSTVSIGRRQPTLQEFRRKPPPRFEKVPFRGLAQKAEEEVRPEARLEGELAQGEIPPPSNVVRGEVEVGADAAFRNQGRPDRKTPYAKLRLEVSHLGGSERASFVFYGSLRHPIDGGPDWTSSRREQLNARLAALAFRLSSKLGEPERFTDRLELTLGRDAVPDVVEAGLVDGVQLGLRFGPVTGFFFAGAAASLNPRREDYDSPIAGGGFRLASALGHSGAVRFSLAYVHEAFRGEGERAFVESRAELRLGGFGARGALVLDRFSNLADDTFDPFEVTTGELIVYAQLSEAFRVEAGYRERRPLYTAELVQVDLDDELALGVGNGGGARPLVGDFFEESARRNVWASVAYDGAVFGIALRGDHFQARESRDSTGGTIEPRLRFGEHWLVFALGARHRGRGNGFKRHVTEYSARLTWRYGGEVFAPSATLAYRRSSPLNQGDERLGLRLAVQLYLPRGFAVRGYLQYDGVRTAVRSPRISAERDVFFAGLAASLRF
ncbi:MAG: hypothetical protein D6731_06180 [Planctomycetota bacterium]|nr:MAG: hypothetical protein D6731_06180 [Planctomycetota bacterium]